MAADDLDQALLNDDTRRFWCSAQAFLVSCANVSKILWGGRRPNERAELRSLLDVDADSPLKSRKRRDQFEHFDERIVDWGQGDEHFSDLDFATADERDPTSRRQFDPSSRTLSYLGGYEVQVDSCARELRKLRAAVKLALPKKSAFGRGSGTESSG